MGMTYVKSDTLEAVANTVAAREVDLGLGIGEAARILGVEFCVNMTSIVIVDIVATGIAAYSFDPEDVAINADDDEQFATCICGASMILAGTGAHKQSEVTYFDFSGMNLVTTRNLAFILQSLFALWSCAAKVYYEKYKPSVNDLNQLIATRR
ncbi:hypothetical protein ES705_44594 [subsurface metagenome]